VITLQALDGRLIVNVEGCDHELRPGQILILNPDAVHEAHAVEASGMLLTLHMDEAP
jgi:quercetin dioxygenase-like cupin family protein